MFCCCVDNDEEKEVFVPNLLSHSNGYMNVSFEDKLATAPAVEQLEVEHLILKLNKDSLKQMERSAQSNFECEYKLVKKLGSGAFASVYECERKLNGKRYAVKVTKRSGMTESQFYCALNEPYLLQKVYHPNVLTFAGFYKSDKYYYMVCEELTGGPLEQVMAVKNYSELEICKMVKMLLEALEYIHARNIVHRDLKMENLMLDGQYSESCRLKIVDFGFAEMIEEPGSLTLMLGTPGYMAPEVIQRKPYGKKVDIWSAGVIVYMLLCGYPPFHHDYVQDVQRLFRIIKSGFYTFDAPYWDNISNDAKDVIQKMLVVDPNKRATATELLQHRWFKQVPKQAKPSADVNLLQVMPQLQKFSNQLRKRFSKSNSSKELDGTICAMAEAKFKSCEDNCRDEDIDLRGSILLPEHTLQRK